MRTFKHTQRLSIYPRKTNHLSIQILTTIHLQSSAIEKKSSQKRDSIHFTNYRPIIIARFWSDFRNEKGKKNEKLFLTTNEQTNK